MTSEIDSAILIWLPVGEEPNAPSFSATGAVTYPSLRAALIAAQSASADKANLPWITTSDAVFDPGQISVLQDTLIDDEKA